MGNHASSARKAHDLSDTLPPLPDKGSLLAPAGPSSGVFTFGRADHLRLVPLSQVPGLHVLASTQLVRDVNSPHLASRTCTCGTAVGGTGPNVLSEALQVGSITSVAEVPDSGLQVVWDVDIPKVFGVQDTSRSPCGSNTRLVSPPFTWQQQQQQGGSSPAAPAGNMSPNSKAQQVASHMQHLSVGSSQGVNSNTEGQWQLVWAMFDHSDSHVSLYLTHSSAVPQQHLSQHAIITPSDTVTAAASPTPAAATPVTWRVTVEGITGAGQVSSLFTAEVPAHEYDTCGGQEVACWGLQSFLTLQELDALTAAQQLRVRATLHHSAAPRSLQDIQQVEAGPTTTSTGSSLAAEPHIVNSSSAAAATPISNGHHQVDPGQQAVDASSHSPALLPSAQIATPLSALLVSASPRILLIDHFLEPGLCDQLVGLATPRLVRSRVSTGMETPSRTSRGTFFTGVSAQNPLILEVEGRIAALIKHPAANAGKKPLVNSEALQVVAYNTGDFYTEHFDNKAGGSVTRHATIIIYLCDCEQGGGTLFPRATSVPTEHDLDVSSLEGAQVARLSQQLNDDQEAARPGVRIMPVKGRAILFWSALPDGSEDLASLHAAEVVGKGSEKWIATRWFKEV